MAYYGKPGFFESAERRKKRRRDPLDERIKPVAYGMSCADLDRLTTCCSPADSPRLTEEREWAAAQQCAAADSKACGPGRVAVMTVTYTH
jgi:hypothetical protein